MNSFWKGKKVLVTGGAGFLGSHVVKSLVARGVTDIIVPRSATCDLRLRENCHRVVQGIDIVIHLAAKVGGIGFNREHGGEMVFDNLMMGIQLMEEARLSGVKKFVIAGTACVYPHELPVPFREEDLWNGRPTEENEPYGQAKRLLLVQSQAYRKQYDFNAIYLIPSNLYGPGDNFDPASSHVVPALIKKFLDASRWREVTVWGKGEPTRDFLYVEDAAEGILLAAETYDGGEPVNLGSGIEVPIKTLVFLIAKTVGFKGEVVWDRTKPDGTPRRCLDISRATAFGFHPKTSLIGGLRKTIQWYLLQKE